MKSSEKSLYKSYDTKKHGLWELYGLADKFYVPTYQRDFSWKEPQILEFLETIEKLPDEEFYIGAIVLAKRNVMEKKAGIEEKSSIENSLFIVDGQQRMTTFTVLTHCMLERLATLHPHDNVKYYTQDEMSVTNENMNMDAKCSNAYLTSLFNRVSDWVIPVLLSPNEDAQLHARIKLRNDKHEEIWPIIFNSDNHELREKSFKKKKRSKLLSDGDKLLWQEFNRIRDRVNEWEVDDFIKYAVNFFNAGPSSTVHGVAITSEYLEIGVNVFFGMNTKGVQLGPADLIKCKLCVTASTEFTDPKQRHQVEKDYVKKWEAFEKRFSDVMNVKEGGDKFRVYLLEWIVSRHHEDTYIKPRRISKTTLMAAYNDDLDRIAENNSFGNSYLGVDNVLKHLNNNLDIYKVLSNPPKEEKDDKTPHEFGEEECKNKIKRDNLNIAIHRMNRLVDMTQHRRILIYIFNTLSDDSLEECLTFNKNVGWITKIINLLTAFLVRIKIVGIKPQSFRPWVNNSLESVRQEIDKENDKTLYGEIAFNTLQNYFNEQVNNVISTKADMSDKKVKSEFIKKSFSTPKDQKFLKGLLWEIEFEIRNQKKLPDTKNDMLKQWATYDIEHIYPQNKDDSWEKYFNVDANDQKSLDSHELLFNSRHDAGNTTLWHKISNSTFQDKPFSEKIPEYEKDDLHLHNTISKNKNSSNDDGWDRQSIVATANEYSKLIIEVLKRLSN